jgi:hypothetical protein
MFELGDDLCFTLKTELELWVCMKQFWGQHLDRNFALEARVVSAINGRHSPAT